MSDDDSVREVPSLDPRNHFRQALNRRFADIASRAQEKKLVIHARARANDMTSSCPAVVSALFTVDSAALAERIDAYFELAAEYRRSDYHEALNDLTVHVKAFAEHQRRSLHAVRPELDAPTLEAMLRTIDSDEIARLQDVKFKLADRQFRQP